MAQTKKSKQLAAKPVAAPDERWLQFYRQMLKIEAVDRRRRVA